MLGNRNDINTEDREQSKKIIIYGCASSLLSQDIVVWSITMNTRNIIQ